MSKLNDKIREILAEAAYEDLGPAVVTPWTTSGPNAAGPVKPAKAPVATNPVTGARSLESDNPGAAAAAPVAPVEADEEEVEGDEEEMEAKPAKKAKAAKAAKADEGDDEDEDDDEEEVKEEEEKDDLEKTFSEMLSRLREEDGEEEEEEKPAAVPPVPTGMPAVTEEDEEEEDENGVTIKEIAADDEEAEAEEGEGKKKKAEGEEVPAPMPNVEEDEAAMFKGEDLPESFKAKASAIFRSTVVRAVKEERKRLTNKHSKMLGEALNILKAKAEKKQKVYEGKLTEQVDMYLNYVVENWMEQNKLAVERGIRAELTEDFIRGLKKLFVEHYIEVPEDKVDVLKALERQVTKLEGKLNEQVQVNAKQRQQVAEMKKEAVVRVVSEGLPATQAEKLRGLAEGIEYTTRKEFAKRMFDLRESYFPKTKSEKPKQSITESVATGGESDEATSTIDLYARTITRAQKNR